MYISNPRDSSEDPNHVHPGNAQIEKHAFPNRQIALATRLPPYASRPLANHDYVSRCKSISRRIDNIYVKYSL